jgi:hypothetical protein
MTIQARLQGGRSSVPPRCFITVCFRTFPYIFEAGFSFGELAWANVLWRNIEQTNINSERIDSALAKVGVEGSNPFARSNNEFKELNSFWRLRITDESRVEWITSKSPYKSRQAA